MREAAVVTVLATGYFVRVHVAEFGFVLVLVIQAFYTVVRASAVDALRASVRLCVFTKLWGVQVVFSTTVFQAVIKKARFVVMWHGELRALESFKVFKHKV